MPLFFFDMHDGLGVDPEGVELKDINEARSEAIREASGILRDDASDMLSGDVWTMTVSDMVGATVCRLRFSVSG